MDPEFFEQLALPLFDQLYNFAHWLTGDRSDAEDLVQETYAKALKNFSSFQEGTNLRAWMYKILRNTFLTSRTGLEAQRSDPWDDDVQLASPTLTPESVLLQLENSQAVMDALAALQVSYREMILLIDVEELSYKDAAQVLNLPIGTVMSRLSRARGQLRQALTSRPPERAKNAV